jgi:hypothetical protein
MSIYDGKQMADLSPEQQAAKAISYFLGRVKADDRLYHLVGLGSQAFDLLTEAHCALSGEDLATVRKSLSGA